MISPLLDRLGIMYRWRAAMRINLAELAEPPALPAGYEVVPWDPARLDEVAQVDYAAYQGTIDGRLYHRYFSTPEGCKRMWRECMSGRFGRFDPLRTVLLLHEGRVCGDLMASQVGPHDAFIGNLAVHPAHRGGTGRSLLLSCLWRYREAGFQRVGLAVTFENERAFRLYQSLGFTVAARFPIVSWSRPGGRRS